MDVVAVQPNPDECSSTDSVPKQYLEKFTSSVAIGTSRLLYKVSFKNVKIRNNIIRLLHQEQRGKLLKLLLSPSVIVIVNRAIIDH